MILVGKLVKKRIQCWVVIVIILPSILLAQSFTDVSLGSNLPVLNGLGRLGAFVDIDADGWLDLFAAYEREVIFYKNDGNGLFSDYTTQSGLSGLIPRTVSIADYNSDGFDDLLIVSNEVPFQIFIMQNNQGNTYVLNAIIGEDVSRAIWCDFDCDGHLDIVATRYSASILFYKNDGEGGFVNVTSTFNLPTNGAATLSAGDYNSDGFPDLYIGRKAGGNQLLRNVIGREFENLPFAMGFSDFRNTVSVSWGDYNQDGYNDIYSANIQSTRNTLFRNNGDESFTDITQTANVADAGDARTSSFIDYNNDGFPDLFNTNHVYPNRLYENLGDGTFIDVASEKNIHNPHDGFATSWGDYDRDGDLDVIIIGHTDRKLNLLRNDGGNNNNWLFLNLIGGFDNGSGIGGKIKLFLNEKTLYKEINAGSGSVGQNAFPIHFGLGSAIVVDSVEIRWPSGGTQKIYNITANQYLNVLQEGNIPPAAFRLLSPAKDTVIVSDTVCFKWERSVDPDSNKQILYTINILNELGDTIYSSNTTNNEIEIALNHIATELERVTWLVAASDGDDLRTSAEIFTFFYTPITKIVDDSNSVLTFNLLDNYPNPFNPATTIEFTVHNLANVNLSIYNVLGERLTVLVNQLMDMGNYKIKFDASSYNSGVYIYTLRSGLKHISKKMLLIK